jgi:DNA-binding transcriptional MerR regulator
VELQRLVLKYDAAGRHLTGIDSMLEKRTADKRKEEEKAMEKHRKKRSELQEERLRRI